MNILALWCRWRGHRWGRAQNIAPVGLLDAWVKECRLCGTVAPVKKRRKKEIAK